MSERLQRLIAGAGLASRRGAEVLIREGRVTVNGRVAVIGESADPERDTVLVDGKPLPTAPSAVYLALYKPVGYTTSLADRHAEHLVTELIPQKWGRVFPIGRLDRETAGLLLLTNDGWLAHRLMHPRYRVPKVYEAWVEGIPGPSRLDRICRGVSFEEGPARAEAAEVVRSSGGDALLRITLAEGRKREVRRLLQVIGHPVRKLTRVHYGGLDLTGMKPGDVRPLTHAEVEQLRDLVRAEAGKRRGAVGATAVVVQRRPRTAESRSGWRRGDRSGDAWEARSAMPARRRSREEQRVEGEAARTDVSRHRKLDPAGTRSRLRNAGGNRRRPDR